MYVAVKGGEQAITAAHKRLAEKRRGSLDEKPLTIKQIRQQLPYAVDRVMIEGSLYDPQLAALAIKQAAGDLIEAIFLLRAFRTTLERFCDSQPLDTGKMHVERRISAAFKDVPGGQVLGPTFDYTHRLLDFSLLDEEKQTGCDNESDQKEAVKTEPESLELGIEHDLHDFPHVLKSMTAEGLIENQVSEQQQANFDITQQPMQFPVDRSTRLQALARGDEGFLLALGYSTQRGYGRTHPFAGEIRIGQVDLVIEPEELGFQIEIGEITLSECEMINQFKGTKEIKPMFTRGYGLAFGHSERKAMSMALIDRALRGKEFNEDFDSPAQDEEFVLSHADSVESVGFVSHLKLPHYVDFQSELELIRKIRKEQNEKAEAKVESAA
ncbi:MAG: alpha-D-ribose 1-methylphosphonate 5-triphosphate synthase subunit PhnI [Pseudomonadales bacterium]|jgi:alpha-D-ribose 1-methylphosphonate 5-triphosphate synthase subunit PhnI